MKYKNFLIITFLIIMILGAIALYFNKPILKIIANLGFIASFFLWSYVFCHIKKDNNIDKSKEKFLLKSVVFFIASFVLINLYNMSFLLFILGIIVFESFLLYIIFTECLNTSNVFLILFSSISFIFIGFFALYITTYCNEDKTLFNNLISVFSALIGGSLTLGGVAWGFYNEREKEEKKNVPWFIGFNYDMHEDENDAIKYHFSDSNIYYSEKGIKYGEEKNFFYIENLYFKNSSKCNFVIKSIKINGIESEEKNQFIYKNMSFYILGESKAKYILNDNDFEEKLKRGQGVGILTKEKEIEMIICIENELQKDFTYRVCFNKFKNEENKYTLTYKNLENITNKNY